ncbi:hypothetical protein ABIA20_000902 [Sinorhizobium fredii]
MYSWEPERLDRALGGKQPQRQGGQQCAALMAPHPRTGTLNFTLQLTPDVLGEWAEAKFYETRDQPASASNTRSMPAINVSIRRKYGFLF